MIAIVLTVLKVIGIALLVILGVVLCVLLLVLFVPVRYRADGSYLGTDIRAEARATWLLHAVSARIAYDKEQTVRIVVKVLGIPVFGGHAADGQKKGHKNKRSAKNDIRHAGEIQAASTDAAREDGADIRAEGAVLREGPMELPEKDEDPGGDPAGQHAVEEPNGGFLRKIKDFFDNFVNFFKNIKFTFQKICDTIGKIKDDIKYYLRLLQLDATKRAFSKCWKQLFRILRKIAPKRFRADLHLGFDDPATMGEVLAVWGMFYPVHQGSINIEPEFDRPVIEAVLSLKGCINVYVLVWAALVLFFDKDLRLLLRRLQHRA